MVTLLSSAKHTIQVTNDLPSFFAPKVNQESLAFPQSVDTMTSVETSVWHLPGLHSNEILCGYHLR